jgi:hypothetical protein
MKEMNKGVQILLERMRSNPDEFVPNVHGYYPDKWSKIIMAIEMRTNGGKDYKDQLPFLNDEEVKALWDGMQQLQGELFTKKVMNILLQDAEELSFSFGQSNDDSKKIKLSKADVMIAQKTGVSLDTYAKLKLRGHI